MKLSEWFESYVKPDLNGVYERRNLSAPGSRNTFCLYRNGWHEDCATVEQAALSKMKAGLNGMVYDENGKAKSWKIYPPPRIQWRGLADRPKGITVETSDKYDHV